MPSGHSRRRTGANDPFAPGRNNLERWGIYLATSPPAMLQTLTAVCLTPRPVCQRVASLPHGTPGGLLGPLRGAFFFHGLGRFFLGLFLTVHAFAHRFTPSWLRSRFCAQNGQIASDSELIERPGLVVQAPLYVPGLLHDLRDTPKRHALRGHRHVFSFLRRVVFRSAFRLYRFRGLTGGDNVGIGIDVERRACALGVGRVGKMPHALRILPLVYLDHTILRRLTRREG